MSEADKLRPAEEVADEACSAANITTCDGYFELDIDAVAAVIEADRAQCLAALQAKLAEALRKWAREGMCNTNDATQDDALEAARAAIAAMQESRDD